MYKIFPLIIVLFIATTLRMYNLSTVPPSPSLDEVSLGYNAYSIMKTGADEYGEKFPIVLRAYDDWRPALYAYFIIPFISLFGLGPLAVRLPAVIFGVLTVLLTYFFVLELFKKSANRYQLSAISSLLLAISPWHIYISRLGHEVNAGLFLTLLSFFSLIKATELPTKRWIIFSAVLSGLSLYTYQSQKIIIPLLLISFGILYATSIKKNWRNFSIGLILFLLISLPVIYATLLGEGLTRFKGTSVFTSDHPIYQAKIIQFAKAKESGDVAGQLINHRYGAYAEIFITNYFSHFSPRWLFAGTSQESHKVPFTGLLYIWEAPLVLLGILLLFKQNIDRSIKILVFIMFFITALPGALTTQAPHAMRTFTFLPFWQIFGALGIVFFLKRFTRSRWARYIFISCLFILLIVSLKEFYVNYFIVFPQTQSNSFQYALSQAIQKAQNSWSRYDKVVVSNEDDLYQSYMFFLFWNTYNPAVYQNVGGTISGGYAVDHQIDNIEFRPIQWSQDQYLVNALIIGNSDDFSKNITKKQIFSNLDGKNSVYVVSVNENK